MIFLTFCGLLDCFDFGKRIKLEECFGRFMSLYEGVRDAQYVSLVGFFFIACFRSQLLYVSIEDTCLPEGREGGNASFLYLSIEDTCLPEGRERKSTCLHHV